MNNLFMLLLKLFVPEGSLQKASFYGGNYASIEYADSGKVYTISICCEDKKESNENA